MNIEKKVYQWQKAGLLTGTQGRSIISFEKNTSKPYISYALTVFAFFLVGLGGVSLVAANWDEISPVVKLAVSFVILGACAIAIWHAYVRGRGKLFEGLLVLFSALLMAEIGLIGQIYQLQPEGAAPFLFWSAMVCPLIFFCRTPLLPAVWLPISSYALLVFVAENDTIRSFFESIINSWFWGLGLLWLFIWTIIYQLIKIYAQNMFFGLQKALKFWIIVDTANLVLLMDFWRYNLFDVHENPKAVFAFVLALGLNAAAYIFGRRLKNLTLPLILSLLLIGSIISLGFVLSLAALGIACFHAYNNKRFRLLNICIFLIGLRIFILYCQSIFSLVGGGLALISSGIVLLILIRLWVKIKTFIKGKMKHEN